MSVGSSIIVCDQRFDVGRRVITFQDDPLISAYTPHCVTHPGIYPTQPAKGLGQMALRYRARRLIGADRTLARLQQVIRQFVIHHDGMGTSRDCFRVLHDERGLSVHFLIDNNGDIYQTLDLVDCGFHAAGVNEISVGVELCNRGDALSFPDFYDKPFYRAHPREKVTCTINGHQFLAYDYTREQWESMQALAKSLARIFPSLPQVYPQEGSGEPMWATLGGDPREYAGYLGHYHVTAQKWDPGPWDFKKFLHSVRGRIFYPAVPGREKSEVPDEGDSAEDFARELYDNNEHEGEGGYFPVGPMGETRLWHGGLHLRDERGKNVVAPFPGKIVAARLKHEDDWSPIGSPNFVLIRHELPIGTAPIKFFTLLFHLDAEEFGRDSDQTPPWLRGARDKRWFRDLDAGEVVPLDIPVGAGDVVGHFGEAGKPGAWTGQVHFEIFSEDEIGADVEAGYWTTLDGVRGGRFCDLPQIVGPIDANRSQTLAHSEVVNFFHNNRARENFRRMAVHHLSEWADNGDWEAALGRARDFAGLSRAAKHRLYVEQIEPMLWWSDNLPDAGLPDDKIVWSYHPITFVLWLHERMKGQSQAARGVQSSSAFGGTRAPSNIQDDGEALDGFMDDEDALFGEAAKSLTLEKLAAGYPD